MTDAQLDILEIKQTLKKMQTDIDELARLIAERESNIAARNDRLNTMNLVPSTQACNDVFDINKLFLYNHLKLLYAVHVVLI